jgi:hypothetical protein
MNRTLITAAGLALATACGLANSASWSVVVQPGVYGRVAIGGYAELPQVYAPQPIVAIDNGYGQVVEETVDQAYATDQPPVYLWVPEYQRTHWAQYCREYGAYGVPVYFVDDRWYRDNVMRRNWTAEQRSWSPQQWLEQDRIARDRFERQRFEQQRYEQQARDQQRWNDERAWNEQQQRQFEQQSAQQSRWNHDRAAHQDQGNRMRWGSAQGDVQQRPHPQQTSQAPGPQPGGQWQQAGNGGQQAGYRPGYGASGGQQPARQGAASQPDGSARGGPIQNVGRHGDRGGPEGHGRGAYEHGREGSRDR